MTLFFSETVDESIELFGDSLPPHPRKFYKYWKYARPSRCWSRGWLIFIYRTEELQLLKITPKPPGKKTAILFIKNKQNFGGFATVSLHYRTITNNCCVKSKCCNFFEFQRLCDLGEILKSFKSMKIWIVALLEAYCTYTNRELLKDFVF